MIKNILLCFYFFAFSTNSQELISNRYEVEAVAKDGFILTENAKIFYRAFGQGKPLIVLHGGPGLTQDYLLPQLYKLAENNFIIFYDQRGCGQSTGEINSSTINIETFVSDLDVIRRAFNFNKISILGHSWGGFLAMEYAIAHPEHIEKLILSNPMPASSEEYALFGQEWTRRMSPYQKELEAIHQTPEFAEGNPAIMEKMYRIIFKTYCYNPNSADLLSLYMSPAASINGAKVYENFRLNIFEKSFNLHESLKSLQIPTLILHGDAVPIPPITVQKIHESIQNSEYVLMKDCGHFPYVEDQDMYFKELKTFLIKNL